MAASGAQITAGVPAGPAERHGQECRLLRHLAIHVDIVEIRGPEVGRPKTWR
jgi:hypothetical protein